MSARSDGVNTSQNLQPQHIINYPTLAALEHLADHDSHGHSNPKDSFKEKYLDLVVIVLFLCACLPFLVMTPVINMTSTVPLRNKIINVIGLSIVVLLLLWSLVFRIIWMIPHCKQRFFVPKSGEINGAPHLFSRHS